MSSVVYGEFTTSLYMHLYSIFVYTSFVYIIIHYRMVAKCGDFERFLTFFTAQKITTYAWYHITSR